MMLLVALKNSMSIQIIIRSLLKVETIYLTSSLNILNCRSSLTRTKTMILMLRPTTFPISNTVTGIALTMTVEYLEIMNLI